MIFDSCILTRITYINNYKDVRQKQILFLGGKSKICGSFLEWGGHRVLLPGGKGRCAVLMQDRHIGIGGVYENSEK